MPSHMPSWEELENACAGCQACGLGATRTNIVVGVGSRAAEVLFVGEGPGYHEDMQGEPFVGAAGQLLDKMLAAIRLDRQTAYIANVVKCRPPQNRDPQPEEIAQCLRFLRYQVMLIRPKIICCLGRVSAQTLISPAFRITREHGQWTERKGIWLMATYHPSALLRDESKKREAWEDLKGLRRKLEELGMAR